MSPQRTNRPTSAYTPPKGRRTPGRDEPAQAERQISARRWRLQWGAVILGGILLFGLVVVFGSGSGDGFQNQPAGVHGN